MRLTYKREQNWPGSNIDGCTWEATDPEGNDVGHIESETYNPDGILHPRWLVCSYRAVPRNGEEREFEVSNYPQARAALAAAKAYMRECASR